ncbi:cell wall-associated NlpC family hydrolase [Streptacidiphilus sp. MAP12-16]|uniref:C40 family peptidase n=1 Tax=Streptacidiphilus sp. MAP12-16 TaxID=3156300 RepID=UPI003515108F
MASHRRARPLGQYSAMAALSRTAASVAAATAAVLAAGGSALADPGGPGTGAPVTADGVRQQLDTLYAQAEVAGQQYDGAREQERALLHQAALLQQRVADEQQHVNTLVQSVGSLAGAEYRQGGGLDPLMQMLFSARPDQYLDRATTLDQANSSAALTLNEIRSDQRQLTQDRAEALSELSQLETVRRTIAGSKAQVQQRLGHAQALLGGLTARQRDTLSRDESDAAGAAAQLADAALPPDQGPASSRAAAALAAARSVLGKPYVYGATGPGAFDCSGLMYWSWRHAGVDLPRTSQEQAYAGRRIPLGEARPGDLVIYYGDMHHVGMYAGNDMVIHAPYPGARVRYERVGSMPVAEVVRI